MPTDAAFVAFLMDRYGIDRKEALSRVHQWKVMNNLATLVGSK